MATQPAPPGFNHSDERHPHRATALIRQPKTGTGPVTDYDALADIDPPTSVDDALVVVDHYGPLIFPGIARDAALLLAAEVRRLRS